MCLEQDFRFNCIYYSATQHQNQLVCSPTKAINVTTKVQDCFTTYCSLTASYSTEIGLCSIKISENQKIRQKGRVKPC